MRSATDMHVHSSLARAFDIVHQARQQTGILAFLHLPLLGPRSLLPWSIYTLFFCRKLAQLDIFVLFFSFSFVGLSIKVLRVSGLELPLSWGFDSSASFACLGFFAAMIGDEGVFFDGASVGDWVFLARRVVGRHSQGKERSAGGSLK